MKAYLLLSGTLFALFAAVHLFITLEHWRQVGHDAGSVLVPALICLASAGLAAWAFRLTRRDGNATGPDSDRRA
jgi:uncharacterized membrane protein YedE/YeeE